MDGVLKMHTVGSSGDDRQTVISSALPLRIRASANDIDHKPHYRPLHDSTGYTEHVNGVVFAYQREACWFLDQITRHFHIPCCTGVGESYRCGPPCLSADALLISINRRSRW